MNETDQKRRISEIKRRHEADLLNHPNVVGVGIGHKSKKGSRINELVITVLVKKKIDKKFLESKDIIPEEIEGFKTDVVESGDVRTLPA